MGAPNPGGGVGPGPDRVALASSSGDLGVVAGISSGSGAGNSVVSAAWARFARHMLSSNRTSRGCRGSVILVASGAVQPSQLHRPLVSRMPWSGECFLSRCMPRGPICGDDGDAEAEPTGDLPGRQTLGRELLHRFSALLHIIAQRVDPEHPRCHHFLEQRCEVRSPVARADFATVVHPPPNGWTTDRPVRPGRTTRLGLIPRRAQPARSVTPTVNSGAAPLITSFLVVCLSFG